MVGKVADGWTGALKNTGTNFTVRQEVDNLLTILTIRFSRPNFFGWVGWWTLLSELQCKMVWELGKTNARLFLTQQRDTTKALGTTRDLLLLLLALQPTVGFSLLSDFLPLCPFFALLSPPSYSHYLQIFFNACNQSLPWSPSSSRTYRFPL
jgi:hypothetical protein